MPFEILTPTAATLNSVTPRKEMHGDEPVSAVSLGLTITGPNTLLDHLDGGKLRNALYMAVPDQEQLPGVEPATPLLRARGIETVSLKGAFEGWTATFENGIDADSAISLGSSKIDKFRVKPMEGGSVDLLFRVGTSDISEDEAGALFGKLGQEVMITLTAPVVSDTPAIDGSQAAFDADHPEAGQADATDLFAQQHGGRGDDEGSPRTSDDMDGPDDADSEGGEPDAGQDDAAAFEAGLQQQIDAKVLKPKRRAPAVNDGGKRKRA